ncbi:MAG TPA: hypothetical protein ENN39_09525 [Desulfonatronum sp.]|nr:hypothetical protein [Desulfonatronum sp.]
MPSTKEEIVELTDVVEEGHPDRPNLSPQSASPEANEALDDIALEKEIDQIFADLGAPSSTDEGFERPDKTAEDSLDMKDLFDTPDSDVKVQKEEIQASQEQLPDTASVEPSELEHSESASMTSEQEETLNQNEENTADLLEPHPMNASGVSTAPPDSVSELTASPAPMQSDQADSFMERLEAMEVKITQMENLEQLFFDRLETRLENLVEEIAGKQEQQLATLHQSIRSELKDQVEQMLRTAGEEADLRHQETLAQALETQAAQVTALVDSRIMELQPTNEALEQPITRDQLLSGVREQTMEHLRPTIDNLHSEWETEKNRLAEFKGAQATLQKETQDMRAEWRSFQEQVKNENQNIADSLPVHFEQLRTDLLRELQKAIPGEAAKVIREEIQALALEND